MIHNGTTYDYTRLMTSLLMGEYGQKLLNEYPSLLEYVQTAEAKSAGTHELMQLSGNPVAMQLKDEWAELQSLRSILPDTSFETMKTIKLQEDEITKKLQSLLDYNPELFFAIYFLSLGSDQGIVNVKRQLPLRERFKTWFAGSQVKEGEEPMTVYHGTGGLETEFTKFEFKVFPGMYFAENKSYSDWFARIKPQGSVVFQCYLRIVNPIDITTFKTEKVSYFEFTEYLKLRYGYELPHNEMLKAMSDKSNGLWAWQYLRGGTAWLKYIKSRQEFDGIHFYENNPDDRNAKGEENITKAWMVFDGNQIKAANGNLLFSRYTNDIRMKEGGNV